MERMEKQNMVNKRTPFCGPLITPKNRRQYLENYKTIFYEQIKGNEEYEGLGEEKLKETAEKYAKLEVQRESAHLKAWLKGKKNYKFKNKFFIVLESIPGTEGSHREMQDKIDAENSKEESNG